MIDVGYMVTKEEVLEILKKEVYDPEIGVNIVDLGLVYDVAVTNGDVRINMTMTSPMCPAVGMIVGQSKQVIHRIAGVTSCEITLVWNPPWSAEKMTDDAKMQLGLV